MRGNQAMHRIGVHSSNILWWTEASRKNNTRRGQSGNQAGKNVIPTNMIHWLFEPPLNEFKNEMNEFHVSWCCAYLYSSCPDMSSSCSSMIYYNIMFIMHWTRTAVGNPQVWPPLLASSLHNMSLSKTLRFKMSQQPSVLAARGMKGQTQNWTRQRFKIPASNGRVLETTMWFYKTRVRK